MSRLVKILVIGFVFSVMATPKAEAIDAGTALGVAKAIPAKVLKVPATVVKSSVNVVRSALEIVRLPFGILQTTVGAPFDQVSNGLTNITKGAQAPIKVVESVLKLPIDIVTGIF